MRCPQVEIIVGPVHVRGHHTDEIAPVLFPEGLAQYDAGNFRYGVRLVGRFQGVGEQGLFCDRLLRLSGVDTGAPEEEEFLHSCISGREEDIILHGNVLCEEFRRLERICQYASHFSCREEDVLWLSFQEERLCLLRVCKIECGVIASDERAVPFALEEPEERGTNHPAVACYVDARIAFHSAMEYTSTTYGERYLACRWQETILGTTMASLNKKHFLLIIGIVVLFFAGWITVTYNTLVGQETVVETAWSVVETQYQRRFDLVPNLVSTVKGEADFEQSTLIEVTNARARATGATTQGEKLEAFQGFDSALARLLVTVEAYPQLRATQGFQDLMAQLEGTENRIAVARKDYNQAVQQYTVSIRQFPTVLIAGMLGFEPRGFFEADDRAEAAPAVDF